MMQLKKEINELCDLLGPPPRYPLEFEKETKRFTPSEAPTGKGVGVAPRIHAEVESRFGVLPNFFRLAPESPEITASLWGFARFAYLDNPLPSLFKERLFVYLSRFCDVRYCIARHVGFLVGLGRPSGDHQCSIQSIEEVLRLIRRPIPRAEHVEPYVSQCLVCDSPLIELPESESVMEEAIFVCATHAFLQTPEASKCLVALKRSLGESRFQHLTVFLAFVRTAHYWTKIHTELVFDEDVKQLLATHEPLAECVLNDPEAGSCEISQKLMDELTLLRQSQQDHDELLRVHQAASESEERFRTLADNISQLAWMCDQLGNVTWYNKRWLDYTGMTFEEMREWGWKKVHHPDHVERVVESVTRSRESGEIWEDTFPLRGKDGNYRWFLSRALPIRNSEGRVVCWFGTNTDITEQREAEEELHKLAQNLEGLVAARTKELQQANVALLRDMEERKKLEEQLLQAQKMESIGTLAGGIAHDFNNILNIIQGYTFILRGYSAGNKQIEGNLTVISETVRRGTDLVHQLLTLARKSSTKLETVNANILVERLIALITQTFAKTIELNSSLEAELPLITADKNQIEQALLNLCVNARDAMPNGGRLTFRTQSVDGASLQRLGEPTQERYVCIKVSDTGMGMDESIQKRIFEPFFTTKDEGQGTGLGLSVVYGIVKSHNGFIDVESRPMSGTSFRLYFPVPTAELSGNEPVVKPAEQTTTASNGATTVLLVDDEEHMLYVLEKTLLKHGYRVIKASDGETAIKTYQDQKQTIDAVLLDLGLPKVAGRDVLLRLKDENPELKVIISSGYLEPELKSEVDRMGVKHFLHKPYMPDDAVRILQSLIESEP